MTGVVRALDAGTLSVYDLVKAVKGADLTVLTSPLDKLAQLRNLESQLSDKGSHSKELDDLEKVLKG